MSDEKLITFLVFIIINFLLLFFVKSSSSAIISLIITHLLLSLFLSASIANHSFLKEIILFFTIYLLVILTLISKCNSTAPEEKKITIKNSSKLIAINFIIALAVIILSLIIIKNLPEATDFLHNHPSQSQQELAITSIPLLKNYSYIILLAIAISLNLLLLPHLHFEKKHESL